MAKRQTVVRTRERLAWRAAILLIAGTLAYWPSLSAPFLFDDQTGIVDNLQIRRLTFPEAVSPPNDTPVAARPLVNLSFAMSYAAADGLVPREFRLANLAIHLLAGLLLFGVLRHAFRLPALAPRFGDAATNLSFAAALLWTLHPLNTEVVNYVVERTESMMGLCYLATIYCSLRARGDAATRLWSAGAVIACAAGMLSKESMVTAPVMVILIDRVLAFTSWRETFAARWRLYAGLAACWGVLAALLAGSPRTSAGFGSGVSAWTYLLNQAQIVAHYLKLSAWPRALVLDYGLPQPLMLGDVLLPGVLIVALIAATIAAFFYRPALGLLGAWFFITLSPTSSFVPVATEVGAERRMYLPLMALIVLFVVAVDWLARRADPRGSRGAPSTFAPPVLLAILCLLMITGVVLRGREYASPLTMAQTIVDRWPNGRGHFLLGSALVDIGRSGEGMAEFRESARDYPGALFAIGTEQLAAGQTADAIETLRRFIQAMPNHPTVTPARDMIARAYAAQGNLPAAEAEARQLVKVAPGYASGHDLLARLLASRGEYAAAAAEFERVIVINGGNAETRDNLAAMRRLAAGKR
jgi:hypothetical protein